MAEAAQFEEVVILATPWDAVEAALKSAGGLSGEIVVDCTNPIKKDFSGLALGQTSSGVEKVAEWETRAKVCKAFNQTGFENMANPRFKSGSTVMFICGDDAESRKAAVQLAKEIGFDAVDAGSLLVVRLLVSFGMLWIHLTYKTGVGRDFAFGILRR